MICGGEQCEKFVWGREIEINFGKLLKILITPQKPHLRKWFKNDDKRTEEKIVRKIFKFGPNISIPLTKIYEHFSSQNYLGFLKS